MKYDEYDETHRGNDESTTTKGIHFNEHRPMEVFTFLSSIIYSINRTDIQYSFCPLFAKPATSSLKHHATHT